MWDKEKLFDSRLSLSRNGLQSYWALVIPSLSVYAELATNLRAYV